MFVLRCFRGTTGGGVTVSLYSIVVCSHCCLQSAFKERLSMVSGHKSKVTTHSVRSRYLPLGGSFSLMTCKTAQFDGTNSYEQPMNSLLIRTLISSYVVRVMIVVSMTELRSKLSMN